MIILDRLMERRESAGRPIRVGMVGAGFMGSVLARQLVTAARGIELVAIANRNGDRAARAYTACGLEPVRVSTPAELEDAIRQRRPAVTENEEVVSRTESIDAVIEVTGAVEFGAGVALDAIAHGKHIVLMNAELDGTLGPVLKHHADRAGVVVSNVDGDQPAVVQNLFRFLRGIGVRPILCGSIKGLEDHYRTPATQGAFAAKWGQNVYKVTSFADGTKISCEQACIANATGMQVARRGMLGPTVPPGTRIEEAAKWFPVEEILDGPGIVDYVVGAAPAPGVFILGTVEDPVQRRYLSYYKMGEGPVYCFQTPYHLCH
ncbi:MAG: Gfo/Idh/MocA family oxidoreductase, partial [Gemmatimonadetes bacterium]|nr:Gfo/Idh/MocA family oxidoreductase [Gemmatimonadota bacterium]